MKRILAALGGIVLLVIAASVAAATAQKPAASPNDTCLMCHADMSAKGSTGKLIGVEKEKFAGSVHGQMQLRCTSCHSDVSADKLPHEPKLRPANCAGCHEDQVKLYQATVHGKAKATGNMVAASCGDCHGKHDILKSNIPESRTHLSKIEATCGGCHGNDALIKQANLPGGNIRSQYHDSVHGQKTNTKGGATSGAPTCTSCHGTHNILAKADPKSRTAHDHILDMCGSCHQRVRANFGHSLHGQLRQTGMTAAPDCVDCHSPHRIQQHNVTKFQVEVINECGNCHKDQITTYRDTFHGQVTELGYTRVATCASCHGSHEILPASESASMVSPENRVATCRQCHRAANANFALYTPHGNAHDRDKFPLLFYTKKSMDWLLIGVFAFFGIHTTFWFVRSLRAVRERRAGGTGH